MAGKLKFDLSRLSWKDSKALSVQQMRLAQAQASRDIDGIEAGFAGIERQLARVVVDVPRDWLIEGAPEQIDWSDPDSFNWLRSNRMTTLLEAFAEAQKPAEASGN
jgi:hypothetical protein